MNAEPGERKRHRPRLERLLYEASVGIAGAFAGTADKPIRRLLLCPPFTDRGSLGDILNRLAWGFSSRPPWDVRVDIPCLSPDEMTQVGLGRLSAPASHADYMTRETITRHCRWMDVTQAAEALAEADLLLIWDARALRQPGVLARAHRVLVIDPLYLRDAEAANVAGLLTCVLGPREGLERRSRSAARYGAWLRRLERVEDVYVFFTGPSLEAALERPLIEGSARLICNSLVRNESAVGRIRPDAVMFLDPAYHMGVSRYAAEFRASVVRVLASFPSCVCIVPEVFVPLLERELPAEVGARLIGIPVTGSHGLNAPTPESFFVARTGNVLTQLMVPIASTLARKVHIVGADGRQKGDRGFWRHLPAAQFGDLLSTVDSAHPSLSRDTNHERYYRQHCRVTERLLREGERRHGREYVSVTPSHIPALAARFRPG